MTNSDIVTANAGLIYEIMNKHFYGLEREDLFQQGAIGIIKAYKNYDNDGTVKFSTYAFKYIFGEMFQLAMQKQIKISKDYLKLYRAIETTRYSLAQKLGYIPSNEEVALFLEEDLNTIEQAIIAGSMMVSSLDKASEEDRSIYETVPQEEKITLDDKLFLQEGLEQLNEEERKIIEYRYFKDMTQSEVARVLKKKQVTVSRYEKKSIEKIRDFYAVA